MASPEINVDDWKLRVVFKNTVTVKQTETEEENAEEEEEEKLTVETLCLSRSTLKHVPASVLKSSALKFLSLEGNQIFSIPGSMFISLPNLTWLDLRKNHIVSLPSEIGSHRFLKTLLLEGNPISELPPELGNVITLRGLNLRDCPIHFPPQHIVHQGVQSILQYLRSIMAERAVSVRKTPPVVEKLQLSELMGSSMEEQDESADELQRFWELKHRLILLDQAELGEKIPRSAPPLVNRQKKAAGEAGVIPELPLFDTESRRRAEERRLAAERQLQQEQAALQQRRNSLMRCFTQFKGMQKKKASDQKKPQRQRKPEGEMTRQLQIPAQDATQEHNSEAGDTLQTHRTFLTEYEEDRLLWDLEQQGRVHDEKMEERRWNPRGNTTEQMASGEDDTDQMRKLHDQLLERKKNRGRDLDKCFTIFTAHNDK